VPRAQDHGHAHAERVELGDHPLDSGRDAALADEDRRAVGQARHQHLVIGLRRQLRNLVTAQAVEGAALEDLDVGAQHVGHRRDDVDSRSLADRHHADPRLHRPA